MLSQSSSGFVSSVFKRSPHYLSPLLCFFFHLLNTDQIGDAGAGLCQQGGGGVILPRGVAGHGGYL